MRHVPWRTCAALLALAAAACLGGCAGKSDPKGAKRVLVLGADGMDPKLVRRMIDEGRLPNLARLEREGGFKPLTTSIPPQSPVAWSNFITGAGPGVHGIFDFIHRDPTKQAEPYFSTNRIVTVEEKDPWKLGGYQMPRSIVKNELLRRGTPFWDYLDAKGIPVAMYHLPANYPPSESHEGHMCCLSGMGVPDALGNQGTHQFFSTRPRVETTGAEGMFLRIYPAETPGAYFAKLHGPPNDHVPKGPEMTVDLDIYPDLDHQCAKVVYANAGMTSDDVVELILNVGEWSGWQPVLFRKTPLGPTLRTMVRFYLQQVRPEISLFVTPLNFDPRQPDIQVSEPAGFVQQIAAAIGPFATVGFAEAFNARKLEVFSDEEYRVQSGQVLDDSLKMLDYALDRYEGGLLFFYFSSTDLQAHIFWWDSDEKHPVRDPAAAKKYQGVIETLYTRIDQALGKCRERLGEDATYLVMSDHGFCNFRRCVGLATWLKQQGYLVAGHGLGDTDWSKSRAYTLGLNGLYLNLKGRERDGIVDPSQRDGLLQEISAKLMAIRDPENGKPVIRRVYRADEWYSGPETKNAPDLIIGYDRGYRASWNTCLGSFDEAVVTDNKQAWSADHCIAHDVVPGILLANKKIVANDPALIDVSASILGEFGVTPPASIQGRSFFEARGAALAAR